MNWRLLDKHPITGDETWVAFEDGKIHTKTVHPDQQVLLDYLERRQNDPWARAKERKRGWTLAGKIPPGIILEWKEKHGVDIFSRDPDTTKKILRLLDSPEYRKLKAQPAGFKLAGTHTQV